MSLHSSQRGELLDQNGASSSSESNHFRYKRLADQLRPTISGSVFVRGKLDEKRPAPPLSPVQTSFPSSSAPPCDSAQIQQTSESEFADSVRLFNAAAPLAAWLVVRPKNTNDVVATIKFCQQHHLSPSIRSGGFSTAGWAIQGDLVMDMRDMDSIRMMLPNTYHRRRGPVSVDVSMEDSAEVVQEFRGREATKDGNLHISSVGNNSATMTIAADRIGDVERRTQEEEREAGALNMTREEARELKRRRTLDGLEEGSARPQLVKQDSSKLPRTKSGESGAEADGESSSDASREDSSHESSSGDQMSSARQTSESGNYSTVNTNLEEHVKTDADGSSRERTNHWVDKSMGVTSSESQSGSTSTMSRSGTSNLTSGEAETDEKDTTQEHPQTSAPLHWDPTSSFEHERWQRHHCPPGTAVNRVQLPTTGGFIWTSDQAGSTQSGSTHLLDSNEPVYLGGTTMSDLQATLNRSGKSPFMGGVDGHSPIESKMGGAGFNSFSASEEMSSLNPGIHTDKFALVELGPGVGIRGLDTFSDRAGRLSSYDEQSESKGKGRNSTVDSVSVGENGIDIVARGVPYHVSLSAYPVGSTVLTTGGFGYMSRAYGLSMDNLVEVEMVLADGRVVVLNESSKQANKEEADLWWAVRGAAPCFGAVTRIIAKAFPVPKVYAGSLIFPFNPATAPSLLRHWRDCLKGTGESIPRELYSNLILTAGPPSGARENVIVIQICFMGSSAPDDIGNTFLQAISSWTGERMLLKDVSEKSFLNQQDGVAQVLKSGIGRRWMTRGDLVSTLTDEAIYKTVDKFNQMGSNRAVWIFELVGGAIEDTKDSCVGEEQRSGKFAVAALQQWEDEDEDSKCVSSVEGWVQDVLSKISVGGPFPCFLERNETRSRCEGSFGKENFARLLEIKRQVDPQGLFRHTFAKGLTEYM